MTKKKTILEEGTIRRFMRLANLNPLSENYFGEEEIHEEEEDELAVDAMDDAEAEAEPMDMDAEAPAEEEPAVPLEVATDVVSKVAAALEDALEIPVEVTSAEPEMGDPAAEPEMDAEPEAVEEPEMEEPAEDAEAYRPVDEEETPCGDVVAEEEETEEEVVAEEEGPQTITNEELVNYISQRVAQRLAEKKKA